MGILGNSIVIEEDIAGNIIMRPRLKKGWQRRTERKIEILKKEGTCSFNDELQLTCNYNEQHIHPLKVNC